jgi:hypothetical protein
LRCTRTAHTGAGLVHDTAGAALPESGANAPLFLPLACFQRYMPHFNRQSPGMPNDANRVEVYAQPKHEVFNIDFWFNKLLFSS